MAKKYQRPSRTMPVKKTPRYATTTEMRFAAFVLLVLGVLVGYFVYSTQVTPGSKFAFKYGLDLVGGTQLVYEADTSKLQPQEVNEAMNALRDVVERRVNVFGVSEPLVQTEEASVLAQGASPHRLIVELPGITDIDQAVKLIGATPLLEFKLVKDANATSSDLRYADTGLTGRYLKSAQLEFGSNAGKAQVANEPMVIVTFNDEGKELFGNITKAHVGEQLGIFLDGQLLSEPVVREPIEGGVATISGNFTPDEAKILVRNLNIGALPVPITLASSQTVGATLGTETLVKGVHAGIYGIIIIGLFLLVWYRLPGLVAGIALSLYLIMMMALFKLIPVTLTAAGIAGFILSIGMAVDANVLIFERTKEELRNGKPISEAVREGFLRAWLSIRDGNATNIIAAIVLFWFGTSIVKGFALVYGLGLIVHMFTAITVTRTFLLAFGNFKESTVARNLFGTGFSKF